MQFDAYVEDVEDLLKTKYHIWAHEPTGKTNVACDEYSIPAHVREHVDYVTPGIKLHAMGGKSRRSAEPETELQKRTFGVTDGSPVKFPPLKKPLPMSLSQLLSMDALSICNVAITPECIRTLYNFTEGTTAAKGNQLGIFEDLGDVYAQEDLNGKANLILEVYTSKVAKLSQTSSSRLHRRSLKAHIQRSKGLMEVLPQLITYPMQVLSQILTFRSAIPSSIHRTRFFFKQTIQSTKTTTRLMVS